MPCLPACPASLEAARCAIANPQVLNCEDPMLYTPTPTPIIIFPLTFNPFLKLLSVATYIGVGW